MKIAGGLLVGLILGSIPGFILARSRQPQASVLAETVVSAEPSWAPTPTLQPTVKPTVIPSPSPSPLPLVTGYTSQQINEFIDKFAGEYGVDPNVLRHVAICESGFNPMAENGAYVGLYQFGPITWGKYRGKMGEDADANLRFDAQAAVKTAAYVFSINSQGIWPNCVP